LENTFDAIIIGAGVIGTSIAFELSKKGFSTLNVDKNPAVGYGSTSASCAIIRTFYSTVDASALAYEGWHYWKNWADHVGLDATENLIDFRNAAGLVYKTAGNNELADFPPIMDAIGCPYQHLDADEISQMLPIIDTHRFEPVRQIDDEGFAEPTGKRIIGGMYFPINGYVNDPQLATDNLKKAAMIHGGQFRLNAQVVEILQAGGKVNGVKLSGGEVLSAPIVINAAGPHSAKTNAMAGIGGQMKIKTRALRQEVASLAAPVGFDYEHDGPVCADADVGTYSRPESDNHMLIGTLSPPCDEFDWVDDPDDYETNITDQITTQVMRQAQRYPGLRIPASINGLVALYDVSDDWNPIYDKSDLPGYYVAIGTSGNQFKNAPLVGKIITAIIEHCEAGNNHDTDPARFHLENINRDIALEAFSRNRNINNDSSFTVLG